ncbi:MAG: DUF2145 domain-containing protein [Acidovorax sp.]
MRRAIVIAPLLALAATGAHAGRACEQRKPTAQAIARGMDLAERTARALDASGARVVVLARAGQDLSKYGLRYSHLGWAYKTSEAPDSPWRVVHKLNDCGTASAWVYRQGLGEFFLDDLWRYEAAWAVPGPAVQQRLLPLLQDNARVTALHQRAYSMVSYAWATQYQQSNQWALETLAAAMEPTVHTREQAQAWLKFKGYEPTALKIGPLTRLGGRVTAANIAFDDHPAEKRFSDRIETVTVDSVLAWMRRTQLADAPQVLRPQE